MPTAILLGTLMLNFGPYADDGFIGTGTTAAMPRPTTENGTVLIKSAAVAYEVHGPRPLAETTEANLSGGVKFWVLPAR